jgi:hypothetical protein
MADELNPKKQNKQDDVLQELESLLARFEKNAAAVKETAAQLKKSLEAEKDD